MLTAKNEISDLVRGFLSGANDYLAKPFSKQELIARISTHMKLSKINISYSRFVPRELLNFLEKESIVDIQLGEQVQKRMTVLFSDIRSFTTLSEKMTPQENFNFINSYLKRVGPIIRKNKGYIDKYIGDSIMALFPANADDAISAALEIQNEVCKYNDDRSKAGYNSIKIGIGLHTDELMLGTIGEEERMEGTVISDGVNLASRVEGLTKYFGISVAITAKTIKNLKEPKKFSYRYLGNLRVKGKMDFVAIFEVLDKENSSCRKIETRNIFENGIKHYYKKNFDKALECFGKILIIDPDDEASQLYYSKSLNLSKTGVPDEWEPGIMTEK